MGELLGRIRFIDSEHFNALWPEMRGCFIALCYTVAEVGTATEATGEDEKGLFPQLDIE
jgi:hypothetical protein